MFTHPEILLDLARQRHDDLVAQARRFRLSHRSRATETAAPTVRARPAPTERDLDRTVENNVGPVGTLSVCETPREFTAARAR
jgi:hypothetical protein